MTAGDRVIVRISDNGRGMPGRFRRQIFGRFEASGHGIGARNGPGTGLGLYIVSQHRPAAKGQGSRSR